MTLISKDSDQFCHLFDVPRETIEKLSLFEILLTKWNKTINLVAPSTIPNIWHRHFIDSAQLFAHKPATAHTWLDIGSGAGFPAVVLAILSQNTENPVEFTLVESDQRKCAFLMTVSNELGLELTILPERVESLPAQKYDVISARAVASVEKLLEMSERFVEQNTICFFPKGAKYESELTEARKIWHIECNQLKSLTDANAVILCIESFARVK